MASAQTIKTCGGARPSTLRMTVRSTSRSAGRHISSRRPLFMRADPSDNGTSTTSTSGPGTIFYGGVSYTNAEWEEALSKGTVAPIPVGAMAQNAVTSPALDSFVEAMAFSGPAPEIINGRLAMVGFVTAAAAELSTGQGVLTQWSEAQTAISLTFLLFIAASLIPIIKNSKETSLGPFTAQAEMLNGRAAMIGFASLLIVEFAKGSALL